MTKREQALECADKMVDMFVSAGTINTDAMWESIKNNIAIIRGALEDEDDG